MAIFDSVRRFTTYMFNRRSSGLHPSLKLTVMMTITIAVISVVY